MNKHKQPVEKLKLVHDYNMKMGAINKNDSQIGNYSLVCKTYKWTTKVFRHYVEEAVFDFYVIYKKLGSETHVLDFKLNVINLMLARCGKSLNPKQSRGNGKHYPQFVPPTAKQRSKTMPVLQDKWNQRRCQIPVQ